MAYEDREMYTKVSTPKKGELNPRLYELEKVVSTLQAVEIEAEEMHLAGLHIQISGAAGVISNVPETDDDGGCVIIRIEAAFDDLGRPMEALVQQIIINGLRKYAATDKKLAARTR